MSEKEYRVCFLYDGIYKETIIKADDESEVENELIQKMNKNGWNTAKEWQIANINEIKCNQCDLV